MATIQRLICRDRLASERHNVRTKNSLIRLMPGSARRPTQASGPPSLF